MMEGTDDGMNGFHNQSAEDTRANCESRAVFVSIGFRRFESRSILAIVPASLVQWCLSKSIALCCFFSFLSHTMQLILSSCHFSKKGYAILARQVDHSHFTEVVFFYVFIATILPAGILGAGLLYCSLWLGNIPLEQLYCLPISCGSSRGQRRRHVSSDISKRRQGVPAICEAASRIQILDGLHKRDGNMYFYDVFSCL